MTSETLRRKISKTRSEAPAELPKIRLCANVVFAAVDGYEALSDALQQLKQEVGNNWSFVTALQLMSGRRGQFAAECAPEEERARLYLAHLVAKSVCTGQQLASGSLPSEVDLAKLKDMVSAVRART